MKINFLKIILLCFGLIVFILGILLFFRIIWFVYPDKNIYAVDGLDVSHHQGFIDWKAVDEKYKFVFVKGTEGITFVDQQFYENVDSIKSTGRIVGAYHFFLFNYNGIDQANNYINTVGNSIDLPPVVDFEFTGNPKEFDRERVANELKNCIDSLENYYKHSVIIYTTHGAYKNIIKDNFDNPIWYRSIIWSLNKDMPNVLFWQYHNSAKIDGINAKVDLNVFKGNLEDLRKLIMKK